jgi:hypothetical protein
LVGDRARQGGGDLRESWGRKQKEQGENSRHVVYEIQCIAYKTTSGASGIAWV